MKITFITILIYIFTTIQLPAQVLPSDSLALVDLYNTTAGNSWTNNSNWLSGNVNSWQGVGITSNRISSIILPNNNLTGSLPSGFCSLSQLKYLNLSNNILSGDLPSCFDNLTSLNTIDLRNNKFTGAIPPTITNFSLLADLFISNNQFDQLPNLSSLIEFSNLLVQNNRFTFEDLEPNIGVANFQYIPQDSINTQADTLINIKDTVTFQAFSGGSHNQYQWIKNGNPLSDNNHFQGTQNPFLTINKIALSDEDTYSCKITNSIVPGLSLTRRIVHIVVNDTRLAQTMSFVPGSPNYCGGVPVRIIAYSSAALPVSLVITNGEGQLKTDTLIPSVPGNIDLKIYNDGNDTYKPIRKDSIVTVLASPDTIWNITKILPETPGEKLELSVTYQNNLHYIWINPKKDSILNPIYSRPYTDATDEGTYTIKAGKNNCYYFSKSFKVTFPADENIIVYELISPDGDGKNDLFYIQNIEKYSDSEIHIFNVWNQTVYKKNNYMNDWSGGDLPGGTYYYLVKIPSQNTLLKGALYLKK